MKYIKQLFLLLTLTTVHGAFLHAGTLHKLVEKGDVKKVEQFLNDHKDVDVDAKDSSGDTLLRNACDNGFFEIAKLLVEHGADVNKPGFENSTPLQTACYYGYFEIAKLLIEHGANVNKPGRDNDTPLVNACHKEFFEIVKLLIQHGADINKPGYKNKTPLDEIKEWSIKKQSDFLKKLLSIEQKKLETKQDAGIRDFIESNALNHADFFNQNETLVPFIIPDKKRNNLLLAEDFKDVQNKEIIISIGEEILKYLFFGFEKNKQFIFPLSLFQQQKLPLHSYVKQLLQQRDMLVLNNGKFKSIEDFNNRKKLLVAAHKCSVKRSKKQKKSITFEDVTLNFKNKGI